MGKSLAEKKKLMASVINKMNDSVGKNVIGFASDESIRERLTIKWIPTPSLRVNEVTGGGIPRGRISMVAGESDSGKTSFLLETIGKNMQADSDFMALWLESEESLEYEALTKVFKIDLDRFVVVHLEKDGAAEVALDRIEAAMRMGVFDICVVNSIKCLTPSKEFENDMGSSTIGLQARMNGKLVRKMTSLISEHDCAFVLVNHLTTDIGKMHGDFLTIFDN